MNNIKIKDFRIYNYRSIYDSGKILVDDRIIVFAGKNESGKTNILSALEKFYKDDFSCEDIPTSKPGTNPTLEMSLSISGKYLNKKLNSNYFDIETEYSYSIKRSKDELDVFSGNFIEELKMILKKGLDSKKDLLFQQFEIYETQVSTDTYGTQVIEAIVDAIINKLFRETKMTETITTNLENILEISKIPEQLIKGILNIIEEDEIVNMFDNIIEILIPKFVYFDNFNDMLPDKVSISDMSSKDFRLKNRGFIHLLTLFGKSLEEFMEDMNTLEMTPQTILNGYSRQITTDYKKIYKQEELKISLSKDGDNVFISIYDVDDDIHPKKPSQRSKGLQWFLAFYLMLKNNDEDTILLIDEPGLYLHASAQEDILKMFNEILPNSIMYSTHSPYLIDTDNMLRIRLVTNNRVEGNGTVVNNKYYASSDVDTLTPVSTAIGYDVSRNPIAFGFGLNILVEGISDMNYIIAFIKLFNINYDIHVIPAQGATTIHLLVSMSIGWKLNYIVLLDTDSEKRKARNQLLKLYIDEDEYKNFVYDISNTKGKSIEDVFSEEDKAKFKILESGKKVSSKAFLDKVQSEEITKKDLSEETKENIQFILDKILSRAEV